LAFSTGKTRDSWSLTAAILDRDAADRRAWPGLPAPGLSMNARSTPPPATRRQPARSPISYDRLL
jgi:hypothetical protein